MKRSGMTVRVYIDTTGLLTDNQDVPKSRVPWLASQTNILANDWFIAMLPVKAQYVD